MEEFYRQIKTIGNSQISKIENYIYISTDNLKKKWKTVMYLSIA